MASTAVEIPACAAPADPIPKDVLDGPVKTVDDGADLKDAKIDVKEKDNGSAEEQQKGEETSTNPDGTKVNKAKKRGPANKGGNKERRKSVTSDVKIIDMSPETALIEFISTSAAYHNVQKINLNQLEMDILKVFPNNVMPANAAAWYMAKKRYYNQQDNKLLQSLLKGYPKKFAIHGNQVEFLETYSKDVAKAKLNALVNQGITSYFAHKVEEHGVYFFDPLHYENSEPFHANLRLATNEPKAHRSKLIPAFFEAHKDRFHFESHSPYLVTICDAKAKPFPQVRTGVTGVIVSMIDNMYGIIQFPSTKEGDTEKAFFSAKSLFKDGWQYSGDPMKLGPVEFDGYRVASNKPDKKGKQRDFTWHAVLVWSDRKPNLRYCASKEDFVIGSAKTNNSANAASAKNKEAINAGVSYEELVSKAVREGLNGPKSSANQKRRTSSASAGDGLLSADMKIAEVLEIRKNGAVVGVRSEPKNKHVFVPGWSHGNVKSGDTSLTTLQGVELGVGDIIGYYVTSKESMKGFSAVGCNVMVMKAAAPTVMKPNAKVYDANMNLVNGGHQVVPQQESFGNFVNAFQALSLAQAQAQVGQSRRPNNKNASQQTTGGNNSKKSKGRQRLRSQASVSTDGYITGGTDNVDGNVVSGRSKKATLNNRKKRTESVASTAGAEKTKKERKPKTNYADFLVNGELPEEDDYNSDEDRYYRFPMNYDSDMDFDEYSDGEISESEVNELKKERDLDIEDLKIKMAEAEEAAKKAKEEEEKAKKEAEEKAKAEAAAAKAETKADSKEEDKETPEAEKPAEVVEAKEGEKAEA